MNVRLVTLLAVVAVSAAFGCAARSKGASTPASPPGGPVPTAADPAAVLPGVDVGGLTPEQARIVAEFALEEFCYCGCPHTVSTCLREHASCGHAARMANRAIRHARAGATKPDLLRAVTAYYAAFDHRARLDVAGFGPPLGSENAPVALVEFSDFTCPYCRQIRPALEEFVRERAGRVKLYYKPFPIESHEHAAEAAQAAEWARDHGLFWAMHDRLFDAPEALSVEDLADHARALGGDAEDLRAALASGKYRQNVRASQAEARTAGLRGTPTIFMNGRLLTDLSPEALELALEDEEEWVKQRGWSRD
jgi:protein-disulfide isomerase